MSKPLSQLIQERIETFQETARIHSKYETECRICQTTLNELETIQTALNEVIKEIEHVQKEARRDVRRARKNRISSDPDYWEQEFNKRDGECLAYEIVLSLLK